MASSIGEQLKQARIQRGLTLEQVAQATHLRLNFLEALENDQRSALPSTVQARGFLRLYAGFLDLPVAPLLDLWDGKVILQEVPPPEAALAFSPSNTPEPMPAPAIAPAPPPLPASVNVPSGPRGIPLPDSDPVLSETIFKEIGAKLRAQREALGLTQPEIERYTRLRQHYLQALEDGRIDDLPSPVQGRGMLSNYATFLNLNEDQLLLRFAEGLQQRRLERMPQPEVLPAASKKRPARQASPLRQFLTPDLIFGVLVVSAILFFSIRTVASISALRAEEEQPTAPAISEVLLTTPTTSPVPGTTAIDPIQSPAPELDPLVTASPQPDAPGSSTVFTQAVVEQGNLPSTTPQATIVAINDDPLQIYIIARQRAWLQVIVDNKQQFYGRIVPGNAYAFSGDKRIDLLTGNAAGLQVFYNQQDLGTLGINGEVVGLVFVPEGIQTPTATLTFTSSPTPRISATPTLTPTGPAQATQTITPFVP